jgi:hypothetical protein
VRTSWVPMMRNTSHPARFFPDAFLPPFHGLALSAITPQEILTVGRVMPSAFLGILSGSEMRKNPLGADLIRKAQRLRQKADNGFHDDFLHLLLPF